MKPSFQLGTFVVVPSRNILSRDGKTIRLEPKVMQVLVYLADHAGEVVSKEEIIHAVWPDVFVTDDVLKRCVSQLRRAFDDDPHKPRAIETITKGGYRLMLSVCPAEPATAKLVAAATRLTSRKPKWLKRVALLLAGAFPIAAGIIASILKR